MNILTSITLSLALYGSLVTISYTISMFISAATKDIRHMSKTLGNNATIFGIITCLLWGLFYHLTH